MVNQETITDTLSWFKIFASQWIQSYPFINNTSQETEKCLRKFLEPSEKPKVIHTGQFFGILQNFVKIYHAIIGRQHLIDLRRRALLNEQYEK